MIKVNKIKIHLFKYKNKNPVLSSFGRMTFRSSLIVELIDQNDNSGFGEIWCNFPNHAGRYRFEIFKDYFVNLLKNFTSTRSLSRKTISLSHSPSLLKKLMLEPLFILITFTT